MAAKGALTFGFAASAAFAPTSAQCLRLRNPFRLGWGESTYYSSGTLYVLQDNGDLQKVYPLPERSTLLPLSPTNIFLNLVKCLFLQSTPVLTDYLHQLEEANQQDEEEPRFPVEVFNKAFFTKTVISACISTATQITRGILEKLARLHLPARVAWKLIKDAARSAGRKAGEYSFIDRAYRIALTACRANLLTGLADLIVSVSADTIRIYVAQNLLTKQYPEQTGSVPLLTQLQRWAEHPKTVLWVHRALSHLSRVSICITMGSIACGAMSAVAPHHAWLINLSDLLTQTGCAVLVVGPVMSTWEVGDALPRVIVVLEGVSLAVLAYAFLPLLLDSGSGGLASTSLQPLPAFG